MDTQILSPVSGKNFTQTISFKGSESKYSVTIVAENVKVTCSPGNHNHGSSKVKLTNVVDYNWEPKYYTGHLLAVHVGGKFFAYGIKGKGGGMVRVANTDSRLRALIKEMNGQVQDLAFAHIYGTVILGCVDEEGCLFVHKIEEKQDGLCCTLMVHITQPEAQVDTNSIHRVVWCPFLPDDDDCDEDNSTLLVLTHGNKAELLNINIINSKHGVGPLCLTDITDGYLEINEHTEPIMDAAFSPDGTAVATASMDGFVKFFQIYMHEGKTPRCLHEWQPHDGRPLSYLDFLDNHHIYSSDEQFWKFAVTGCKNNTELKIWSCETWSCLQTITFSPNPNSAITEIYFKVRLDLSSGYLILSEINSRILYVLEMQRDLVGAKAYARSISEFLLPAPFLSFGILEAALRNFRCANSNEDLYPCEENDDFDDGQSIVATVIRMYVVQPKRLQECHIAYQTESCAHINSVNSPVTTTKSIYQDVLSDISSETLVDTSENQQDNLEKVQLSQLTTMLQNDIPNQHFNDLQSLLIQPPLNLMTPDAFSSPVKNDLETQIKKEISSPNILMNSTEIINDAVPSTTTIDAEILFQRPKDNFASGGSSPSREVQEILSLNNSNYSTHEYYEDGKVNDENTKKNGTYCQGDTYQNNSVYNESSNLTTDWPTVPIIKAKDVLKTEESRLSLQDCILKSGDNIEHIVSLNHKDPNVQILEELIVALMSTVREQSSQLQSLQSEIKGLKISQDKCNVPEDLENVIEKQLELALARSHAQQAKLFEHWANSRAIKDREYQESLAANMSHLVTKQVHEKLNTIINIEMKQSVLPVIAGTFENLKHVLQEDFQAKLNNLDLLLKETLNKLLSSKPVADSLSNSLAPVIRPNMEKCYKEAITNYLIPSWEKACGNMFIQIHDTFNQGTKEYTASVESYMEKQRKNQDKSKDLISQMQNVNEIMLQITEKLSTTVQTDLQKQMASSFASLQDKLMQSVSDVVNEQIAIAFRNHAASLEDSVVNAVRSRAVTPSPHVIDTQTALAQIQQLLARGELNTAFQQALSASDLSLVVYICERLNPQAVFGSNPCPLQQHVLLSLIQQLSADMNNHTDLKHRYLEEAVLNLDRNNPVTREHMASVLKDLNRQLMAFIANNPTNKIIRNMKMLQMATQSFIKF